jgi:hypothetical protein
MLALAILTAEHAHDLRTRFASRFEPSSGWSAWLVVGILAGTTAVLVAAAVPHFLRIRVGHPSIDPPAEAVAVLKQAGFRGNIAVPFTWGEYVIWHLGPAGKVSVDGRRETVYSEAIYAENVRFALGRTGWGDLVTRPETALVLTDRKLPCDRLMGDRPDWEAVHEDKQCRIFARVGTDEWSKIRQVRVTVTAPREFPG